MSRQDIGAWWAACSGCGIVTVGEAARNTREHGKPGLNARVWTLPSLPRPGRGGTPLKPDTNNLVSPLRLTGIGSGCTHDIPDDGLDSPLTMAMQTCGPAHTTTMPPPTPSVRVAAGGTRRQRRRRLGTARRTPTRVSAARLPIQAGRCQRGRKCMTRERKRQKGSSRISARI